MIFQPYRKTAVDELKALGLPTRPQAANPRHSDGFLASCAHAIKSRNVEMAEDLLREAQDRGLAPRRRPAPPIEQFTWARWARHVRVRLAWALKRAFEKPATLTRGR